VDIKEALKEARCRLSCGANWIYWDEAAQEWVVMTHRYHARKSEVLYRGMDEEAAVAALLDE
jgi:hypothetical protein